MGPYAGENAFERQRLTGLMRRLTPTDFDRSLPNGWTVGTKPLHLAFWDRYCLCLLREWESEGFSPVSVAVDALNESARAVTVDVPPARIVSIVAESAETVDYEIDELPDDLITELKRNGYERVLRRALHRREHLAQSERVLSM